jgi:endonuclease VIII-like 1
MPELAELRLSSDYVNEYVVGKTFNKIIKTPTHKGPEVEVPYDEFTIRTESRGKELKMYINDSVTLMFGFGMTGGFEFTKNTEIPKYAHLQFHTSDGYVLSYVDVRRFGRWKLGDWKVDRSPDPTTEFSSFVKHIKHNLDAKAFDKPIYELLMNQKYCNGIGNYLRAEILGRIDSNPFVSAREYIKQNPQVLELCKVIPLESYLYKKKHNTVYGVKEPYLRYYKSENSLHIEDKGKRVFWYDSKWGQQ